MNRGWKVWWVLRKSRKFGKSGSTSNPVRFKLREKCKVLQKPRISMRERRRRKQRWEVKIYTLDSWNVHNYREIVDNLRLEVLYFLISVIICTVYCSVSCTSICPVLDIVPPHCRTSWLNYQTNVGSFTVEFEISINYSDHFCGNWKCLSVSMW